MNPFHYVCRSSTHCKTRRTQAAITSSPEPKGVYKPLIIAGKLVYTSGHLPVDPSGKLVKDEWGLIWMLPPVMPLPALPDWAFWPRSQKEFGSLDRIRRVVKVLGAVNCTAEFTQQPAVINGCSELFAEIFGPELGIAARSAIGVNTLPLGVCVEIEAIFELH